MPFFVSETRPSTSIQEPSSSPKPSFRLLVARDLGKSRWLQRDGTDASDASDASVGHRTASNHGDGCVQK